MQLGIFLYYFLMLNILNLILFFKTTLVRLNTKFLNFLSPRSQLNHKEVTKSHKAFSSHPKKPSALSVNPENFSTVSINKMFNDPKDFIGVSHPLWSKKEFLLLIICDMISTGACLLRFDWQSFTFLCTSLLFGCKK